MLASPCPTRVALPNPPARCSARPATRPAHSARELVVHGPGQRRRVLLPAPPRHRDLRRPRGPLDVGITGLDMLLDSGAPAETCCSARLRAARRSASRCPAGAAATVADLAGRRIATSYAGLLRRPPRRARHRGHGRAARRRRRERRAPRRRRRRRRRRRDRHARCARPASGRSATRCWSARPLLVRRAGRRPRTPRSTRSSAACRASSSPAPTCWSTTTSAPSSSRRACAITPGIESPTVSPLHDAGWSAVRAMVPAREVHRVMDELYDLGARGILVTDIHACRL